MKSIEDPQQNVKLPMLGKTNTRKETFSELNVFIKIF